MLALVAGQGSLPRTLATAQQQPPLICMLEGFEPEGLDPDIVFRLETLGSLLARLQTLGVTRVCFCGSIRRPQVDPARIDPATVPLVPRLQQALTLGDDGALRIVIEIFEEAGLQIVGADSLMADLLPPVGVATISKPGPEHALCAQTGLRVLSEMGARDLGQACVVDGQSVLAREDSAGTDAMLLRVAQGRGFVGELSRDAPPFDPRPGVAEGLPDQAGNWIDPARAALGGVLFKGPKPGQDRRADLPAIGPVTADHAAAAGLEGIILQAGGVMVLHKSVVIDRLNRYGLFLWVWDATGA